MGRRPEKIVYNTPDARLVEPTPDEVEFCRALQEYKRARQRPFPTWREVLAVARSLGYRKVEDAGPLPVPERPHAGTGDEPVTADGWRRRERGEGKP